MNKIDTKQWKEYVIKDLFITEQKGKFFQVPTGSYVDKKQLRDGKTPRITVTGTNNGVYGYFDCSSENKDYRIFENFISVSFLGTVFYQKSKVSLDMKVHCLKPLNIELNEYTGLFLVAAINKSLKNSSYADQISSKVLAELSIKLPADKDGNPDFSYMEEYMKNREIAVSASLTKLQSAKQSAVFQKINTTEWATFHLYDIFKIDSGTKLDKAKMDTTTPKINFVGRSNFNNGITQKVNEIQGLTPYESGCLTLALGGAYLGSCFIQEEPFYTSQNVVVLIPKEDITFEAKQFIATAIFKESQNNYRAFIKELNAHIKRDFVIKLPTTVDGTPDYDYMTEFIRKIKYKGSKTLTTLQAV